LQNSPSGKQFSHCIPPKPHDESDVPGTHLLPMQQPVGHVDASQFVCWQLPPVPVGTHASPTDAQF
jgi:hypothetical protein